MSSMWIQRSHPESRAESRANSHCPHCGAEDLVFDPREETRVCARCVASAKACRDIPVDHLRPGALKDLLDILEGCYVGARYPGAPATIAAHKRARKTLESYGRLRRR